MTLPEDLSRCEAALARRSRPARVVLVTGSTNDDARTWAAEGARDGAVVIADAQERGRGRHGRVWSTPAGESLAMSVVLRPRVLPNQLAPIALVAGLAVRSAIAARVDGAMVKWPNDVVLEGRKIAGILVEASLASTRVEHVVVGIGVNVARRDFPEELIATSLALAGADDLDRGTLALDILDALDREVSAWLLAPSSIGRRLQPFDALADREVVVEGTTILANAGEVRAR